nr:interactor of HORMAD1 protein 1 isoform X2 [Pelodiscus sinensis]XP_025037359.1 interactor of HORMAD1 protein 1 isoform X2 [Pelodiscus sinensis]|eukprot:XP_025037358.1 interactor of HORMAD1 protein 1 isoform X2 [Pelodiscus sinensis]
MNFNVWTIKEMFSTPIATRTNKSSSRSSAPSDYSSLSDSQFLFGSQFCPENSQSAPVPLELSVQARQQKSSQQNSQDSEPSIFTKYHTKPQLFGGDEREKGSFNFGVGKLKNILEQFEVNKKTIKEKYDSEVLSTFVSSVKESIQGMQTCLDRFEETLDSRNKSILDGLEDISKTLHGAAQAHYGAVLSALADRSHVEQRSLEVERRLTAKDMELSDVKSNLQSLKESLELLTSQQNKQHQNLCEQLNHLPLPSILEELQTLISASRFPRCRKDNASQTSPDTLQGHCVLGPEETFCQCHPARRLQRTGWFQTQLHTMPMANSRGDSPRKTHTATGDTHRGALNTAAGSGANLTTVALRGKENVMTQELESALAKQPSANSPAPACCSNPGMSGGSHGSHWLRPQEIPPTTPLRKAVRKDSKRVKPMTPSPQNQSQLFHPPAQSRKAFATDNKTHITVVGNMPQKEKFKNPCRSKIPARKRMYITKRKGDLPKCPDRGPKKKMTSRRMELEDSRQNDSPPITVTVTPYSENSILGSSVPRQQKLSRVPPRQKESTLSMLHSRENRRGPAAERRGIPGHQRRLDICNTQRTLSFWEGSPWESDLNGENHMTWFSVPSPMASDKAGLSAAPAQHTTPFCSLVFDSDYSD